MQKSATFAALNKIGEKSIPMPIYGAEIFDSEFERDIACLIGDDCGDYSEAELSNLLDINFSPLHANYYSRMIEKFCEVLGVSEGISYRTYKVCPSWGTTQVLATLTPAALCTVLAVALTDREKLMGGVKAELTERSGFMPLYPAKFEAWGAPETWEPAQWGLIFRIALEIRMEAQGVESINDLEFSLCEELAANGIIQEWAFSVPEFVENYKKWESQCEKSA